MDNATPDSSEDPLNEVGPRLIACMDGIVAGLTAHKVAVETGTSFLLDRTDRPYLSPRTLDGIPIEMYFVASVPAWSDQLRYHLRVGFLGERRWSVYEPPKGFKVSYLVARILKQLEEVKLARSLKQQTASARSLAEARLVELSMGAEVSQESTFRLRQDNLRIDGLPDAPGEVQITVRTSHANAAKIVGDYRIRSRTPRVE